LEEADEALYWLEVSKEAKLVEMLELDVLIKEANELVSIFNVADITAKKNRDIASGRSPNLKIPK
jgi:hypothetical protein